MTFDIPSEYENVLNQLVASGAFPSTESAFRHALQLLADQQQAMLTRNGSPPVRAMPNQIEIEDLANQPNASVFDVNHLAPADAWPPEEQADDFLAFVNESRKDVSNRGTNHR